MQIGKTMIIGNSAYYIYILTLHMLKYIIFQIEKILLYLGLIENLEKCPECYNRTESLTIFDMCEHCLYTNYLTRDGYKNGE